MSNNDYTKYSREPINENTQKPETKVETEAEKKSQEVKPATEPVIESITFPEATTKTGYVYGCSRLNVRSEPKSGSAIVCTVDQKTEVEIDLSQSTEDYYKVCLASGVEGFCVKSYIIEK